MLLALACGTLSANAQTNDEVLAGLQFEFSPPGARSLGVGRAFTGQADDATAAFANPAGLALRPAYQTEISVEARSWSFTTRYINGGSFNGSPSGLGIDDGTRPLRDRFNSESAGLAFASLAFSPLAFDRWSFAVYRHLLTDYRVSIARSEGAFFTGANGGRGRAEPIDADLALGIVGYGASAAYALTSDRNVSIGFGAAYYTFSLEASTRRYDTQLLRDTPGSPSRLSFERASFSLANVTDVHLQHGEDEAWGVLAGILWRSPRDRMRIGAAFRSGPDFKFDYRFLYGPFREEFLRSGGFCTDQRRPTCESLDRDFVDPGRAAALSGRSRFKVPDVASAGASVAFGQSGRSRVFLEYSRLRYSALRPGSNVLQQLVHCADTFGNEVTAATRAGRSCAAAGGAWVTDPTELANFKIEDGSEPHVGVEYEWPQSAQGVSRFALILRAGVWLDPAHQLRYEGEREALRARFQPGDDDLHRTLGLGIVVPDTGIQIDLAADLSDRVDSFSASVVIGFERAGGAGRLGARN